jgi:hypothetical protein
MGAPPLPQQGTGTRVHTTQPPPLVTRSHMRAGCTNGDMTSVWLTPEIVHFAVSKYLSCSYTSWSSPEHLCSSTLSRTLPCSAMLSCALLCSAVLSRTLPHSAARLRATFTCFTSCPLASPVHVVPLSFLVTTYTLVPGPLGLLVYKPHVTTLLKGRRIQ